MSEAPHDNAALAMEAKQDTPDEAARVSDTGPEALQPVEGSPTFPPLRTTATKTSSAVGKPYSSFSSQEKWFIVLLSAMAGIFSYVTCPLRGVVSLRGVVESPEIRDAGLMEPAQSRQTSMSPSFLLWLMPLMSPMRRST